MARKVTISMLAFGLQYSENRNVICARSWKAIKKRKMVNQLFHLRLTATYSGAQ